MKLLFENWRNFVNENEEKEGSEEKPKSDLKSDIISALRKEGGAAGMDGDKGLKAHTGATEEEIKAAVEGMPEVGVHPDGDYILDAGDIEVIDENKICPKGIAWAKRTFDTYPSAYANLAASKYCKDPNYAKASKGKSKKRKKKRKRRRTRRAVAESIQKQNNSLSFKSLGIEEVILEKINSVLDERCQKGYKTHPKRKTKKMYGKTYRNCIKAEEVKKKDEELEEGALQKWLNQQWVRVSSSGKIKGKCGTSKDKKNPDRCLPKSKAQSLSQKERAATAKKKKRAQKSGKDSGKTSYVSNTKKAKVRSKKAKA